MGKEKQISYHLKDEIDSYKLGMPLYELESQLVGYKTTDLIGFWSLKKVSGKEAVFWPDEESKKYVRFDFLE